MGRLEEDIVDLYAKILELRRKTLSQLREASRRIPDLQALIVEHGNTRFFKVKNLILNSRVCINVHLNNRVYKNV